MSRFDAVIQEEEKENPFDKSNRTLKGALEGQKEIERNIDKEGSEEKMEKQRAAKLAVLEDYSNNQPHSQGKLQKQHQDQTLLHIPQHHPHQ